ncbi:phosphoribosylaminoimidazolesuccinocarboxamide synthase [Chloroflexota bacterium]
MSTILETKLSLPIIHKGKVRDTYDLGDKLLLIATDRISAFDSVLPCGIPDKGLVLNQLSAFWFSKTKHIIPNHVIDLIDTSDSLNKYLPNGIIAPDYLVGRSMVIRKAERVPVEAVVRGYVSGSAWAECQASGTISGIAQPKGIKESQELPYPMFTPTTKADTGHDLPLTQKELEDLVGKSTAQALEEKSIAIYQFARDYAQSRDIIIADTKFEFGFIEGNLSLIDELLTPDSSRFWDITKYIIGQSQPSYDKQPTRDWLTASGWNKEPPAPTLPKEIIEETSERYRMAFNKLVGREIQK